jgi:uncharacterized oxidoreductase
MEMTGNTILITGGGSGIGRGLAEAFHAAGNQVIIAGRRKQLLDQTTAANPGMKSAVLNIEDAASIASFAAQLVKDFPTLNVVVHNAGIMRMEDVLKNDYVADAEAMVTTNLLGPIRLTSALLPVLERQASATIMTVTSGLAFLPLALTPTYCATKAAMHSYSESLRYQLKGTKVRVVELAPPYVQTELMGPGQASDPRAMPLADFIAEVMEIIRTQPEAKEILVGRVKGLRFPGEGEKYEAAFEGLNAAMSKH